MKPFIPLILSLIVLISLTACNTPCDQPGSAASIVSKAVVSKWACKAPDKVLSDMSATCSKLGLCSVPPKVGGAIANFACPLIVKELQSAGNAKIADWQCDPSLVGADFAVGLTILCEQLPF